MLNRTVRQGASPTTRWEANANDWIRWAREPGHDSYWRFHRDAFLQLLPEPPCRLLDLGCGEGRLSRDLRSRGYEVVGVDASRTMVDAAKATDPEGTYIVADAASLPFPDRSFRDVVAFMSLHDMDDIEAAIAETVRVMDPAGYLCMAIVHPINSAGSFDSEAPDASYIIRDPYTEIWDYTEQIERDGMCMTFSSIHRPLGAYFHLLETRGLVVDRLREVGEDAASAALAPRRERWRRLPLFLHLRARRP